MYKEKTKSVTATNLEAATKALAKAAGEVVNAEARFLDDQSPSVWASVVEARANHSYMTRCADIAASVHADAERLAVEQDAQAAEAQRLEALSAVQAEAQANIAASIAAGEALAAGLRRGYDFAIKSQGLGGTGINSWPRAVQDGIGQALVREGFPAASIRVAG